MTSRDATVAGKMKVDDVIECEDYLSGLRYIDACNAIDSWSRRGEVRPETRVRASEREERERERRERRAREKSKREERERRASKKSESESESERESASESEK